MTDQTTAPDDAETLKQIEAQNKALNAAGLPDAISLDELKSFLSDEEVAAVTTGEDSILEPITTDADAEPAADDAPAEDAKTDEAAAVTAAETPAPAPDPVPALPLPDVAAAQQAVTDADEKLQALAAQFNDGDLTTEEWQTQQQELLTSKATAMAQIEVAQTIQSQQQEARAQAWFAQIDAYHARFPDLASEAHIDGWDAALRSVTGSTAYASLPMDKQIDLAHRLYADHLEVTGGGTIARPDTPEAPEDLKKADGPRTDPRPEPPHTLTGMSGAEPAGTSDDGTFAAIDRMMAQNPERAEEMFARLSPEQQEAFLG